MLVRWDSAAEARLGPSMSCSHARRAETTPSAPRNTRLVIERPRSDPPLPDPPGRDALTR